MKLRTFYVKSYRSITEATLDNIQNYGVFVGPNNAGKSNLLRAIYISLSIALEGDFQRARRNRQYSYAYRGENYNWERDIPVNLRENKGASTTFKLTFEFSDEEKADFRQKFNINLTKSLQMKFQLFSNRTEYNIIMPGRAKKPMEEKMQDIGLFIRSKLDYEYIPCVRSSELTNEYFSRLLSKEFRQLDGNEEYQRCLQTIQELQLPIVQGLENKLSVSLKTFLPNIKGVSLQNTNYLDTGLRFYSSRGRSAPINIDDGDITPIDEKGDGIKSLAAIALIESISFENLEGRSLILCIEEPEAHLHPDAIHSLRTVLFELSERSGVQVIISTHSPLLIDRDKISNNVIVGDNHRIHPCSCVEDVRQVLGVRISDNLAATKVVLVEGESDKRYFETLCKQRLSLRQKLEDNSLQFVNVHSASKMDFQIRMYNSIMVSTLVLLDSDSSGIASANALMAAKIKRPSEILLIKSAGMRESELEDLVNIDSYSQIIKDKYNINLNTTSFKQRRKVWSDRLHIASQMSPCILNPEIEAQIKTDIADIVVELGMSAIADYDKQYVESIVDAIEAFAG
ncbi:MAG: hypothetical protein EGQ56_00105 [Clostridiales bacterium]|nr:hypothetical protein [Clostridiales bacterium]